MFFSYPLNRNTPDSKVNGANRGPPGSCRPQMGPMLAPWTLLSGTVAQHRSSYIICHTLQLQIYWTHFSHHSNTICKLDPNTSFYCGLVLTHVFKTLENVSTRFCKNVQVLKMYRIWNLQKMFPQKKVSKTFSVCFTNLKRVCSVTPL